MIIASETLLQELIDRTQQNSIQAQKFLCLKINQLASRPTANSWSILECLEHLDLYGDFYIPEIRNRIESSNSVSIPNFKSGLLGNYFANSMLPRKQPNKMKTFKNKNPIYSKLDKQTINRFILQQEQLIVLLNQSKNINIKEAKTNISISSFIKLRLGDTFRVVVYHNERHIAQASRIASTMSTNHNSQNGY